MKIFLLACPCSADIFVSAGQAGDRVTCPSCRRAIDVPKLRELGQLRERENIPATQTRWSPTHAVLLAGVAAAAIAWLAALAVLPRGGNVIDPETIRAAVQSASDQDVYKAWKQSLSRSGIQRPPTPDEQKLLRLSQFSTDVSRGLQIMGALGAVVAAAAALRLFARPTTGVGQ